MVSRRSTGPLRKILPAVAVALVALGVTACSSGQVTQTDSMEPAVNGNMADVGEVALRNVVIAYPESGSYASGDDAPLRLAIINNGGSDDELTSVSSPAAGSVEIVGGAALPARSALEVVVPADSSATSSAEPTESATPTSTPSDSAEPSTPGDSETSSSPTSTTSETPEPTASATAPDVVGAISIVLRDLTADLVMGKNVPITFVFENAGQVTVNVPIDTPEHARQDSGGGEE